MKHSYSVQARSHTAYIAFVVHRVSGLLLALFLPLHFWVLSRALNDPAALDGFLDWTENPLVKVAETGLVLALAMHLAGGLRLLALEFLNWRDWQKNLAAVAACAGITVSLIFALRVV